MIVQHLVRPLQIGQLEVKNRIGMAPVNNSSQMDPDGSITQRCIDYYVERARGGTGLIITGVFKVENEIEKYVNMQDGTARWPLFTAKSRRAFAELADCVHAYGCRLFVQLSAGPGRVAAAEVIRSGMQPVSSSENPCFFVPEVTCRALKTSEVEAIVEAFGKAAELAAASGIDGIEVHGHEGYLIDQFTTATWNRRTDKYGGDLEGRLRFPVEIIRAIKSSTHADFPVIYRYGLRHFITDESDGALSRSEREYGRDFEEALTMARLLQEAGYDALDVDFGAYESAFWAHPPYYHAEGIGLDMVEQVKKSVEIPVLVAGRLGDPRLAEATVAQGQADMVLLGRPLLADPYWAQKVLGGSSASVRPCIGCDDACTYRPGAMGVPMSCSVNPRCNRESRLVDRPVRQKKKVLIVGGGVAGMELARGATLRGHDVVLYEKSPQLGGQLRAASIPDFKRDLRRLVDWYAKELECLAPDIRLGEVATVDEIKHERPDTVVVATGATYKVPTIPGLSEQTAVTCSDLLLGATSPGDRVVILGGGMDGCETALWLAQRGTHVTLVEQLNDVAGGIYWGKRKMLLRLLRDTKVTIMTKASIKAVEDGAVTVRRNDGECETVQCSTLALAAGMEACDELYYSLVGQVPNLHRIGDCKHPRKVHDAIWEAWVLAGSL